MEKLHFKVSSGLKDIIGRDLITNELVAIFELVKNSYDANAKRINIIINSYEDSILIQDDGYGMNYQDLQRKWLFVAYSEKKEQSTQTFAGSKGIGRFSCDRLGKKLELFTKKNNEKSKLTINWGDFEQDSLRKFEDLEINYYDGFSDKNILLNSEQGTTLKISNLRDEWNTEKAKRVAAALQRLINPFVDDKRVEIYVKYNSSPLGIPEFEQRISNQIANVLDGKTTYLECRIKNNEITIILKDNNSPVYNVTLENYTILDNVYFKVYYLSTMAKNNFTRVMRQTPKDYGSIFLYKNDFRIFPYGEPDFDSFALNLRKSQGYNRYLGHRELLGWINVTDTKNHFKEVSSRDRGFVDNEYTISLEKTYMELVHRPLESYVQLIRFGESNIDEISFEDDNAINKLVNRFKKYSVKKLEKYELSSISTPLDSRLELLNNDDVHIKEKKKIQQNIKHVLSEAKKQVSQVTERTNKVEKENKQIKRQVENTKVFLEENQPAKQALLTHELGKISKELNAASEDMFLGMDEESQNKYFENFYAIRKAIDKLSSLKKQILKLNIESFVEKETVELKTYIKSYLTLDVLGHNSLSLNTEGEEVWKKINIYDFGVLLDNLILNVDDQRITNSEIHIYFEENGEAFHFISNSGPIKVTPINNIFDLGVSSKNFGTGMGMYICKRICKDFGWDISVSEYNENLVDFKITLNCKGDK